MTKEVLLLFWLGFRSLIIIAPIAIGLSILMAIYPVLLFIFFGITGCVVAGILLKAAKHT